MNFRARPFAFLAFFVCLSNGHFAIAQMDSAEHWISDLSGTQKSIQATFKATVAISAGTKLYLQDGRPTPEALLNKKRDYCILTAENWWAEDWGFLKAKSADKNSSYTGTFDDTFTNEQGHREFFNNTLMEYNSHSCGSDLSRWTYRDLMDDLPVITNADQRLMVAGTLLEDMIDVDEKIISNLATYDDSLSLAKLEMRNAELRRYQAIDRAIQGFGKATTATFKDFLAERKAEETDRKQSVVIIPHDYQGSIAQYKALLTLVESPVITLHLSNIENRPRYLDLQCHFRGNDYEPKLSDLQNIVGRTISVDLDD
jgi:hypothetical protein